MPHESKHYSYIVKTQRFKTFLIPYPTMVLMMTVKHSYEQTG